MERLHKPDRTTYLAYNSRFSELLDEPLTVVDGEFDFAKTIPVIEEGRSVFFDVQSVRELAMLLAEAYAHKRYENRYGVITRLQTRLFGVAQPVMKEFDIDINILMDVVEECSADEATHLNADNF